MSKLIIEDQRGRKTTVPLTRDSISIGREEGNTIRLNERNVSRFHLELRRDGEHFLLVERSRWGSILNGRRFSGETRLYSGDTILVGDYRLSIELDAPAPDERPQPPLASIEFGFPRLSLVSDGFVVKTWQIRGPVILGSSPRAHISIDRPGVLRSHIRLTPDGGIWVAIAGDRATTFRVNGKVCQRWALQRGDVLEVGGQTLRWTDDREFQVAVDPVEVGRLGAEIPLRRTWTPVGLCANGQTPPAEEPAAAAGE